jgi:hypothetical protein
MQGMAHEIWLNRWGVAIDQREQQVGTQGLTSLERLIHILWLISQSMRATGDLVAARQRDPTLFRDGLAAARALDLPGIVEVFASSAGWIEAHFFEKFDDLCRELQPLRLIAGTDIH